MAFTITKERTERFTSDKLKCTLLTLAMILPSSSSYHTQTHKSFLKTHHRLIFLRHCFQHVALLQGQACRLKSKLINWNSRSSINCLHPTYSSYAPTNPQHDHVPQFCHTHLFGVTCHIPVSISSLSLLCL